MGIHTALRIGDLLRLKWDEVYDFDRNRVRDSIEITEQKTSKSKIVKLNSKVVAALSLCVPLAQRGDFLLKSRKGENKAISRIQAYRIVRTTAEELGLNDRVSCYSLRKAFGYHAWKNGTNPAVIMDI
jgi:integrase